MNGLAQAEQERLMRQRPGLLATCNDQMGWLWSVGFPYNSPHIRCSLIKLVLARPATGMPPMMTTRSP